MIVGYDGKVFDRTGGQVRESDWGTCKPEFVVERLNIDDRIVDGPIIANAAQIAPQIGEPVTLMRKHRADLPVRFGNDIAHACSGIDLKAQRHYVRGHAGGAPRRIAAGRHRKAEHEVLGAGEAMHEKRRRCGHNPRQAADSTKPRRARRMQMDGPPQNAPRSNEVAVGDAGRIWGAFEIFDPVLAIAREIVAGPIGDVVCYDRGKWTHCTGVGK